jgi:hypothetical protein
MRGTIVRIIESIELASSGVVDEEMMKASMMMIMKMKMRKRLAEPFAFLVGFGRQ